MTPPARGRKTVANGGPLLDGMTVILTGATGGIGRHVARALAAAGAKVGITDLKIDAVETLTDDLSRAGLSAIGGAFDASSADDFDAFRERVRVELGEIDGLVNCAGLWEPKRFQEISLEDLRLTMMANFTTAFVACQSVLPKMILRHRGSVVNFASTAGEYGSISPGAHYAAAKGAVIAMTKSLAREAGPYNVRINAISPGPIDTVALGAVTPQQKADIGARTLFGRLGEPDEVAAGCVYLLSSMSSFVTGHVLRINGGSLL